MNTSTASPLSAHVRPARRRAVALAASLGLGTLAVFAVQSTTRATAQTATPTSSAAARSDVRTISVHGTGRVSQVPDQITITLGVQTQAATAASALNANSTKSAELIALLKGRGVADKDLQTSQLSVYPQYDNQGRKITAYQVTNTVTVRTKDVKGAGALVDAAASVAGDAIRVNGLSFSISDPSASLAAARAAAVKDARVQAEQYATAAGVKLGALRAIAGGSASIPSPVYAPSAAKLAAANSVPVEAGSQEVSADVELVFDIA